MPNKRSGFTMKKRSKAAFIGSLVLLTVAVLGSGRLSKNHGDRRASAGEVFEGSERTCITKRRNSALHEDCRCSKKDDCGAERDLCGVCTFLTS
jgi:hypothetical protein